VTEQKHEWFVLVDGNKFGPCSAQVILQRLAEGRITIQSLVWREEMDKWKPLCKVEEFSAENVPQSDISVESKPAQNENSETDSNQPHKEPSEFTTTENKVVEGPFADNLVNPFEPLAENKSADPEKSVTDDSPKQTQVPESTQDKPQPKFPRRRTGRRLSSRFAKSSDRKLSDKKPSTERRSFSDRKSSLDRRSLSDKRPPSRRLTPVGAGSNVLRKESFKSDAANRLRPRPPSTQIKGRISTRRQLGQSNQQDPRTGRRVPPPTTAKSNNPVAFIAPACALLGIICLALPWETSSVDPRFSSRPNIAEAIKSGQMTRSGFDLMDNAAIVIMLLCLIGAMACGVGSYATSGNAAKGMAGAVVGEGAIILICALVMTGGGGVGAGVMLEIMCALGIVAGGVIVMVSSKPTSQPVTRASLRDSDQQGMRGRESSGSRERPETRKPMTRNRFRQH